MAEEKKITGAANTAVGTKLNVPPAAAIPQKSEFFLSRMCFSSVGISNATGRPDLISARSNKRNSSQQAKG